jgi:hypothetical protein
MVAGQVSPSPTSGAMAQRGCRVVGKRSVHKFAGRAIECEERLLTFAQLTDSLIADHLLPRGSIMVIR